MMMMTTDHHKHKLAPCQSFIVCASCVHITCTRMHTYMHAHLHILLHTQPHKQSHIQPHKHSIHTDIQTYPHIHTDLSTLISVDRYGYKSIGIWTYTQSTHTTTQTTTQTTTHTTRHTTTHTTKHTTTHTSTHTTARIQAH